MVATIRTPFSAVKTLGQRLEGSLPDYDGLLEQIGGRKLVVLGGANQGCHEFYRMRADITRRLIEEKGFEGIAVEADWPDTLRLNRFLEGAGEPAPEQYLPQQGCFPEWVWRNEAIADFMLWLRQHNHSHGKATGFFGMDLFSPYRSAAMTLAYLRRAHPEEVRRAQAIYQCLDQAGEPEREPWLTEGLGPTAENGVLALLMAHQRHAQHRLQSGAPKAIGASFYAGLRSRALANTEPFFRTLLESDQDVWRLHQTHRSDTLLALLNHLQLQGGRGKLVVWANNAQAGDARANAGGRHRQSPNLGQLLRQRLGAANVLLVGFTTHKGRVTAAHEWGGRTVEQELKPSLDGSLETLFYRSGLQRFYLPLDVPEARPLEKVMLERSLGFTYRPEAERACHYFRATVERQFDALFHLDETTAVRPLAAPGPRLVLHRRAAG